MPKVKLSDLFYVAESTTHGKGLFARRALKKGEYLGSYKGPLCHDLKGGGPHVLWVEDEEGGWVGRDGRNILRYLNHHHKPCVEFNGFELFALRNIPQDSEIFIHYGEEFVTALAGDE